MKPQLPCTLPLLTCCRGMIVGHIEKKAKRMKREVLRMKRVREDEGGKAVEVEASKGLKEEEVDERVKAEEEEVDEGVKAEEEEEVGEDGTARV
jgi:hypothetical protein